jgi:Nitronate monooxygenase
VTGSGASRRRESDIIDSSVSPALYRFDTYVARVGQLSLRGNASTRGRRVNAEHQCARSTWLGFCLRGNGFGRAQPVVANRDVHHQESSRGAPLGYPEIHYLTSPLRAGSVRAGDPQAVNVWAGSGFQKAKSAPVAEIGTSLT